MPFLPLCFVRKRSCGLQSEVENGVLLFCSIFRPSQRKEKLFSHLEMVINKTVGQAICKKPEKLWYFNLFLKELPIQNLSWPSNVSCVKLQPARALESTSCFSYAKELRHSLLWAGHSQRFTCWCFCEFEWQCLLFCPLYFSELCSVLRASQFF